MTVQDVGYELFQDRVNRDSYTTQKKAAEVIEGSSYISSSKRPHPKLVMSNLAVKKRSLAQTYFSSAVWAAMRVRRDLSARGQPDRLQDTENQRKRERERCREGEKDTEERQMGR